VNEFDPGPSLLWSLSICCGRPG